MSESMVKLSKRGIREFVKQLCEDFGVEEYPVVEIVSRYELMDVCGWFADGCYNHDEMVIMLDKDAVFVDAELVLHEFYHHVQHLRGQLTSEIVENEMDKPHCERDYEAEAKGFARAYVDFYAKKWDRLVYRD